jgi:transcriptional regulator EpsA
MPTLNSFSSLEHDRLLGMTRESLAIRSHLDFLLWLNGNLQQYLPHEMMIAATGDFSTGALAIDVIDPEVGLNDAQNQCPCLVTFVRHLRACWSNNGSAACVLKWPDGMAYDFKDAHANIGSRLESIHCGLVHGTQTQRGNQDSFFIVLSTEKAMPPQARGFIEMMLPYFDAALRRLPLGKSILDANDDALMASGDACGLSKREQEIMSWVRQGKTNNEIGLILNISVFTVKNHMQRIFKKMDVLNRAQAVSHLSQAESRIRHG